MQKLIIVFCLIFLISGCATTRTSHMSTADQIAAMEADQKARKKNGQIFKTAGDLLYNVALGYFSGYRIGSLP